MSEHWRRDAPGFYNLLALERKALDAPDILGGLTGALMSADPRTGSQTFVLHLPPGFKGRADAKTSTLELFLLRGEAALDGEAVGASGYIHIAQGCGGGEVTSQSGTLALAFWNPNLPCWPYPVTRNRVVKAWAETWVNSMPGAHGVKHKSLRKPDPTPHVVDEGFDGGPGGYLRFQYIEPGMIAAAEHVHHECFEEIILLQGDCFLVNEGQMGIGSVVVHPQEWYHAPFASRSGALILVHTDGPMGYPWPPRNYPEADKLAAAYLDGAPWDTPTEHIPWNEHPIAKMQEQSAAYQAWRKSPCGCLWGDHDTGAQVPYRPGGQGTASRFRASWTRNTNE
jgi:hypothetical protein